VELVRGALTDEAVSSLYAWAKAHRYVFLRFSHSDAGLLARLASLPSAQRLDAFPLYPGYAATGFELVIDEKGDDQAILAGFHREARRQIRRALDAGYVVHSSDGPEHVAEAWAIIAACSRRKRFTLHWPVELYLAMTGLARPHKCARTYTVYSEGRAIGAAFLVRDRDTAVALRAGAELKKPSCSALMHWVAMRDMFRAGVRHYSFGPVSPPVSRFKDRFSPRRVLCPPPVTVEIVPRFCRIWYTILSCLVAMAPALRWLGRTVVVRWPFGAERITGPEEVNEPLAD
jgi:hypothetical protein